MTKQVSGHCDTNQKISVAVSFPVPTKKFSLVQNLHHEIQPPHASQIP